MQNNCRDVTAFLTTRKAAFFDGSFVVEKKSVLLLSPSNYSNNKPFLQSFNSFLSFFSYLFMESLFCSFSYPSPLCSCPILPFFKSAQKHMIFCYPRFIRRQNLPLNHATSYTSLEVSLARVKILLG